MIADAWSGILGPRGTEVVGDLADFVTEARASLALARPLEGAEERVPGRPGLYAIYAESSTWLDLSLGDPPDDRPLYLGKSEDSLAARDLKMHFGDGRTGQSTVRRSFAALARESLGLRGMPRNPRNPGYFSNYGLSAAHDAVLTRWMKENLRLAVWPKPADCEFALAKMEIALLAELKPPLNVRDVVTPWTAQVKAARRVMANEAAAWAAAG